ICLVIWSQTGDIALQIININWCLHRETPKKPQRWENKRRRYWYKENVTAENPCKQAQKIAESWHFLVIKVVRSFFLIFNDNLHTAAEITDADYCHMRTAPVQQRYYRKPLDQASHFPEYPSFSQYGAWPDKSMVAIKKVFLLREFRPAIFRSRIG